ncbi:MAG: sodium-dependent transporter [Candidatus Omnitrophica bacterium]|nr:sodium-dependent transporter [Candidatus Omnitrophota bacterium]
MVPHRAQWTTQWGFLLAAIGSAIGLGSIWRFAYVCYENGGGAYLIPYGVALVTAGVPLMILEYGIGHRMRGSAPMSFAKLNPHWEWLGWWMVIFVMFGIVLYYAVVIAWCVCYLGFSTTLAWGADPNHFFFQTFLGVTPGPHVVGDIRSPILLALVLVWVVNWLIVFFGVEHGIEKANKIFMPLLMLLILALVAWTATLPGAMEGMLRYWRPDFSKLANPKVWIDAYSQIFFTLSLGFGIMVAYASYLPRKADITSDAWMTCLVDTAVSLVAGLAVFGTLGYMAAKTGKPFEEVVQHGIGLAFVAYPQAISLLPSFQQLFGVLFFLMLTVAGIASSISILEAFSAAVIDKFHYPRRAVVTVLSIVGFLGGIIFATGGGLAWLDIVDHFLSHYGLFVACILQCLLVGWVYGARHLREHVNAVSRVQVGRLLDVAIRYLIPGVLAILFVSDFLTDIRQPYGGYPWLAQLLIGRDWLLVTLIVALFVAGRRWRRPLDRSPL